MQKKAIKKIMLGKGLPSFTGIDNVVSIKISTKKVKFFGKLQS
jgi:hypothetical protein